jgi:beta-glucosidase
MLDTKPNVQLLDARVAELLDRMTLPEKIGQMNQIDPGGAAHDARLQQDIREGRIGSILNEVDPDALNELQRIAVEESRLGIPLLVGRDVIHGFRTVLPIPLGLAAAWDPDLVRDGARLAAREAAAVGINWTFAPMIDIARDPRWGRIAESFGEDPCLSERLGVASIEGFQGADLSRPGSIAACAKHFAGYGAAESGRDYASTNVSENELRNVYLRPFRAAVEAGVASLMTSFSDIDGIPATGNDRLLRDILREEWGFDGLVVSDWDSVRQLAVHGLTEGDADSALAATLAGVNMEMAGGSYLEHLPQLVESGAVDEALVDELVAGILRIKLGLGLFENPYTNPAAFPPAGSGDALELAEQAALRGCVLLENRDDILPLSPDRLSSIAVIGPLADDPYEQLGTWVFDGDAALSVTPLQALRAALGDRVEVRYVKAMETSRSRQSEAFNEAAELAAGSDLAVLFLGEESILSGEAHSRADIGLPGDQEALVRRVREAGKPVVAVIMAGRPLTLTDVRDQVDAMLYAWHPGTMGGPAIAKLLLGEVSPSGKLPATFPRMVGQAPLYYNQKNTGKPPSPETVIHIEDISSGAFQTSHGMTAFFLDAGYEPLYPFGYGLSYGEFRYGDLRVERDEVKIGEFVRTSAELTNVGTRTAEEVVQLYVRDLVGNVTRPVRELKDFRRVRLEPGESTRVEFELHTDDLSFYDRRMRLVVEPGEFHVWIGGSSDTELRAGFRLVAA